MLGILSSFSCRLHSILLRLYSPLLRLGRFFSFLYLHTVGRNPWTGDQPVARPLPKHRTTQRGINALSGIRTHEPSVRESEGSSRLRRAVTVIGCWLHSRTKILYLEADRDVYRNASSEVLNSNISYFHLLDLQLGTRKLS
jgi:hypothetical protein